MLQQYYIGEVAKHVGVTVKAIRHYESIGLIDAPQRKGRYRIYTQHEVEKIKLIREAKEYGFALSEIRELISSAFCPGHCERVFGLIDKKRGEIIKECHSLNILAKKLADLKTRLQAVPPI